MLRRRLEAEGFEMIGEDEQGVHEGIMAVSVFGYGRQIERWKFGDSQLGESVLGVVAAEEFEGIELRFVVGEVVRLVGRLEWSFDFECLQA